VKTQAHVLVSGEVQGVFFRQETKRSAEDLNVKGWVRNRPNGSVEAVFEGEEKDVQAMVEFCRHGPPGAFVTDVKLTWEPYAAEFNNFRIRYVTLSSWTP
jgi:acylphosphatase